MTPYPAWEFITITLARYFAIVFGFAVVVMSSRIGLQYLRTAASHGVKVMWRDLRTLNLNSLLPIHVATVCFVTAGYAAANSYELFLRFDDPLSWRLVYLPLNLLGAVSILLVTLFVRNKGERVVSTEQEPVDRTEVERRATLRRDGQDERTHRQDVRDDIQEAREVAQSTITDTQETREVAQMERETSQNKRKKVQDHREVVQNEREEEQS